MPKLPRQSSKSKQGARADKPVKNGSGNGGRAPNGGGAPKGGGAPNGGGAPKGGGAPNGGATTATATIELNKFERGLLSDLFAVIEEHAQGGVDQIDRGMIERAFLFACERHADQRRQSGEGFIIHPAAVAKICAEMRLDTATMCAALLHDTVEDPSAALA